MEFLDGIPLHDIEKIKKKKINLRKVLRNGYYVLLKQVFVDGFFHADPHPGNILVLSNNRIGLIDFGILGHFDKKLKRFALDLLNSFLQNDPDKTTEIILKMNPKSTIDTEKFRSDVYDLFEQLQTTSIENLEIGPLIKETLSTANKHNLKIPTAFVLYGKTLALIEGIALRYDPGFDFNKETADILKKLIDYKFFAKEAVDRTKSKFSEYQQLIESFPETANLLMEKAKNFKLGIDIEDADIRNLTLEMERSSGNLALGLIVASLVVGSSLIMQKTSFVLAYTSGFVLAAILGIWLVHRTIFVKLFKKDY